MDVLRKELEAIYAAQRLGEEPLDAAEVACCRNLAGNLVAVDNACAVVTDAAADRSYFFAGLFARLLGVSRDEHSRRTIASSDEDFIYERIHPEDLVDKRMLEYEFFRFVDRLPADRKLRYKAVSRFRMRMHDGCYRWIDNSTQLLRLSPAGRIWLILCRYDLAPVQTEQIGIDARIVCNETGEILPLSFSENRGALLSAREREILQLIRRGRLSKEIAAELHVSIHTVNRHRQNILRKLSVDNSLEAVRAAIAMKLI